jgi:hypothetical protein
MIVEKEPSECQSDEGCQSPFNTRGLANVIAAVLQLALNKASKRPILCQ